MTFKSFCMKVGPGVMAGIGIGGMWASSILMAKKTAELKDKEYRGDEKIELNPKVRFKKYFKECALPLSIGLVSSGLIAGSVITSYKAQANLIAGYEGIKKMLSTVSEKVEKKGISMAEVKKEIYEDCVTDDLYLNDDDTAGEEVLFLDLYRQECMNDGFFKMSRAKFYKSVSELLYFYNSGFDTTLNDFYDFLEIPRVPDDQGYKGWLNNPRLDRNFDGCIKIDLVKGYLDNGELYFTINYVTPPEEIY